MQNYNLENVKILCLDPSERGHVVVKTILSAMRVKEIKCVLTVKEAFAEMGRFRPDIVITEYDLETTNAFEFIRQIRTGDNSPDPYVPVILLTAQTERPVVVGARDSGANYTMAKPISVKELYRAICRFIEESTEFVKTKKFFGPDRRRRNMEFEGEDRRQPPEET